MDRLDVNKILRQYKSGEISEFTAYERIWDMYIVNRNINIATYLLLGMAIGANIIGGITYLW